MFSTYWAAWQSIIAALLVFCTDKPCTGGGDRTDLRNAGYHDRIQARGHVPVKADSIILQSDRQCSVSYSPLSVVQNSGWRTKLLKPGPNPDSWQRVCSFQTWDTRGDVSISSFSPKKHLWIAITCQWCCPHRPARGIAHRNLSKTLPIQTCQRH